MTHADAAEAFYCRLLSFQREFEVPASETKRDPSHIGLAREGAVLHLSSRAGNGVIGGVVYFMGVGSRTTGLAVFRTPVNSCRGEEPPTSRVHPAAGTAYTEG